MVLESGFLDDRRRPPRAAEINKTAQKLAAAGGGLSAAISAAMRRSGGKHARDSCSRFVHRGQVRVKVCARGENVKKANNT